MCEITIRIEEVACLKNDSSFQNDDIYLETIRKRRRAEKKPTSSSRKKIQKRFNISSTRGRFNAFMQQNVELAGSSIIPDRYRSITYLLFFLFLPKVIGMGFFFFYVAAAKPSLYAQVHSGGSMLDWVIGYEILLAVSVLIIGKKLYTFMFIP